MYRHWFYLFLIVLVALVVRLYQIGSIPPSLTWDEVAWGYNAYSLGIDGKDEFGKFLPITYLESFGDFKPPLYAYLTILPIKFLGLNEFATRFPSGFFGVLSVLVTYFLVLEIFGREKRKLALVSSFLLAISPWHIMLSRAAFEANAAQFLIVSGVFLFLIAIRTNIYFILLSLISFILSMYTFNSARIVVPLLVVCLVIVFYRKLIKFWKIVIPAALLGFILYLPLLLFLNTPQAKLRFNEVNIFSDSGVIERVNRQIENDDGSFYSKIIHNRRFAYGVEYVRHYFDNLTPQFLFIKGDGNPKFSIQDVGQLYLWEIPFLIGGILLLFRKRVGNWWIVPTIIIIGIIPAGFARETPHALRIENTLPAFQILTALGVVGLLELVHRRKRLIIGSMIGVVIFLNFAYFIHNYFTHYAREFSGEWQYGYKESIAFVENEAQNYSAVYVTEALGRAYIYYLFHMKINPQQFRENSDIYREPLGFVHVTRYNNINFTDKISTVRKPNTLYIATPGEKPEGAQVLREFKLLNGNIVLVAYTL